MDKSFEKREKKIERLDTAFLFIISLVGLLFTIMQVATEGLTGLLEILPLLILGVALPFYIGYVRGTLEINSLIERVRGWVFLTVGVIAYFAFFIESFGVSSELGALVYGIIVTFGLFSIYYLEKWFVKVFNIQDDIANLYAFYGTAVVGAGFAYVSRFIILICTSLYPSFQFSELFILQIFIAYSAFLSCLSFEKMSRQIIKANPPFTKKQKETLSKFNIRMFVVVYELFGSLILTFGKKDLSLVFLTAYFSLVSTFFEAVPIIQYVFGLVSLISLSLLMIPFIKDGKTDFSILGTSKIELT